MAPKHKLLSDEEVRVLTEQLRQKNLLPARWGGLDYHDDWKYVAYRWSLITGKVEKTRRPVVSFMKDLGIEEEIRRIFTRNNMAEFFDMLLHMETNGDLVEQFLATVEKTRTDTFKFKYQNDWQYHEVGIVNLAFGLPALSRPNRENKAYNANAFWKEITGGLVGDYKGQHARASAIRNPVIRYLERILGNTIYARSETGTVTSKQLYGIWCLLHKKDHDFGRDFLEHHFEAPFKLGTRTSKIRGGGLISVLMKHLGFEPCSGPCKGMDLGFEQMNNTWMFEHWLGKYCIRYNDDGLFPLPNKKLVTLVGMKKENVGMNGEQHLAIGAKYTSEIDGKGLRDVRPVKRSRGEGTSGAGSSGAAELQEEEEQEYEEGGNMADEEEADVGEGGQGPQEMEFGMPDAPTPEPWYPNQMEWYGMRTDLQGLRADVTELRTTQNQWYAEASSMRGEFQGVRSEVSDLKRWMEALFVSHLGSDHPSYRPPPPPDA